MGDRIVRCGECHALLGDDIDKTERLPCTKCGSLLRLVEIYVSDSAIAHEKIGLKAKRIGFKRPIKEIISGDEYQVFKKRWAKLYRIIDRENDRYHEKVADLETGEVYYECNETLSEHINHGSAKNKIEHT